MAHVGKRVAIAAVALFLAAAPVAGVLAGEAAQAPLGHHGHAAAADPAIDLDAARQMFNDQACSACHTLADADAWGPIGPAFDGSTNLDRAHLIERITNGYGAMPPFAGQLTEAEIAQLADYIRQVAASQ